MPTRAAMSRARDTIERICAADSDARVFRAEVLAQLDRALGFDAYVWLLTDPRTAVGCAPLADCPCLHELPTLIKYKYLTSLNRWTTLTRRDPAVSLARATDGDLARSDVWRQVLCRYDIADVASAMWADDYGSWGFLDLWRAGQSQFSVPELQFLRQLAPMITRALRERQARTFIATARPHQRSRGPVVLVLDDDLRVMSETAATTQWLEVLLPPRAGESPIPASVYNVAAQLLAVEQHVDDGDPSARLHLADGYWLTVRAARLSADTTAGRLIAVTLEESSPLDRLDVFCRANRLSGREGELLTLLVGGHDTRAVAAQMYVSEHTVQDHLKAIFKKTGAHNRRSVVSRILGTSTG